MMTFPGLWSSDPAQPFDSSTELEHIISIMAQAYELETDLSVNGADPALSGLLTEAEMLWATASLRLHQLVCAPSAPEPIPTIATLLFALLVSDGTDPGQDRHHLRGLASVAETLSHRQDRMLAQIVRALDLMSQIYADQDPFEPATVPSFLTSSEQGS